MTADISIVYGTHLSPKPHAYCTISSIKLSIFIKLTLWDYSNESKRVRIGLSSSFIRIGKEVLRISWEFFEKNYEEKKRREGLESTTSDQAFNQLLHISDEIKSENWRWTY